MAESAGTSVSIDSETFSHFSWQRPGTHSSSSSSSDSELSELSDYESSETSDSEPDTKNKDVSTTAEGSHGEHSSTCSSHRNNESDSSDDSVQNVDNNSAQETLIQNAPSQSSSHFEFPQFSQSTDSNDAINMCEELFGIISDDDKSSQDCKRDCVSPTEIMAADSGNHGNHDENDDDLSHIDTDTSDSNEENVTNYVVEEHISDSDTNKNDIESKQSDDIKICIGKKDEKDEHDATRKSESAIKARDCSIWETPSFAVSDRARKDLGHKIRLKLKHRDKFSAMKALMYADKTDPQDVSFSDSDTSDEHTCHTQRSYTRSPAKLNIVNKPESTGNSDFDADVLETKCETRFNDASQSSDIESSNNKSDDDDVVFVSIGNRSIIRDETPVIIPDTDSDNDDVVIVRTEKLKHKGLGKKSWRNSERKEEKSNGRITSSSSDVIVCSNSDENDQTTVDASSLSLLSDNTDNNLVYPQVPATDSCMCDVFGMGAFGCTIHAPSKVQNPLHKALDVTLYNLGDRPSTSTAESDQLESGNTSTMDQSDELLPPTREGNSGTPVNKEKDGQDMPKNDASPLLDMPLDFQSFLKSQVVPLNLTQKSNIDNPTRSKSVDISSNITNIQPESEDSLNNEKGAILSWTQNSDTGSHVINIEPELNRSSSLPSGSSELKRQGTIELGDAKKRRRFVCETCLCYIKPDKVVQCMGGHNWCSDCMEVLVKTLLMARTKGTLKCGMENCGNYFPTGQLVKVLPPMIVDVLQTKFEQECLSMVDDELVNNEQDEQVGGSNVCTDNSGNQDTQEKIQRNQSLGLPVNWDETGSDENYILVDIATWTVEYSDVVNRFYDSMKYPRATILQVERVQNHTLWQFFSVKRNQMIRELGEEHLNEQKLFHGTKKKKVPTATLR